MKNVSEVGAPVGGKARPPRRSPIQFQSVVAESEHRGGWEVAHRLEDEGDGPWLIDLSHRARWDYQDTAIGDHRPLGLSVPPNPGDVVIDGGLVISRMNRTQVSIGHIGAGDPPKTPNEVAYTDTTDSHAWVAVLGAPTPDVLEAISNLDLFAPGRQKPHLTQGPVLHVSCQVITLAADGVLMAMARGYGQSFVDGVLHSTRALDVRPAGERRFNDWTAGTGNRGST